MSITIIIDFYWTYWPLNYWLMVMLNARKAVGMASGGLTDAAAEMKPSDPLKRNLWGASDQT